MNESFYSQWLTSCSSPAECVCMCVLMCVTVCDRMCVFQEAGPLHSAAHPSLWDPLHRLRLLPWEREQARAAGVWARPRILPGDAFTTFISHWAHDEESVAATVLLSTTDWLHNKATCIPSSLSAFPWMEEERKTFPFAGSSSGFYSFCHLFSFEMLWIKKQEVGESGGRPPQGQEPLYFHLYSQSLDFRLES